MFTDPALVWAVGLGLAPRMSLEKFVYSRRFVLAGLLGSAASAAFATPPEVSLRPIPRPGGVRVTESTQLADLIRSAGLSGKVSCMVADAQSGEILETENPLLAHPPASVVKAVTALYALEKLGSDFRFRTQLVATGPVSGGRLKGDLVLVGGGDPSLNSDTLFELARMLKDAGVQEVTGKFRVYDKALPRLDEIDPKQPVQVGYNPGLSGLNLNYNRVYFEWRRSGNGHTVTMDARTSRLRPRVDVIGMSVAGRDLPVYTYKSRAKKEEWTVARSALGKEGGRWLPVRKPGAYAADVFRTLARSHGIDLKSPVFSNAAPKGTVLATQSSSKLSDILLDMLDHSNNMTAEAIGLSASLRAGKSATALDLSGRHMANWLAERFDAKRPKFVDHSGLGDDSRLTPGDMVKCLNKSGFDGPLRPLLKEFVIKREDGKADKSLGATVLAKTGSLNFVSTLAGFITTRDGRQLTFAIFTSDMDTRARIPREERERPPGARSWSRRSRALQSQLLRRWIGGVG